MTPNWLPTSYRLTLNPTADSKKFNGNDTRSHFGELSKSDLQIWRAFQISSQNLVTITHDRLLTDSWQTSDRLLTDFWLTPDWLPTSNRLTLNPTVDSKKNWWRWQLVPIWRAFQISSPNLVTVRLLTDYWQTPDWLLTDSWMTPEWLLTDFWLTTNWLLTHCQLQTDLH